MVKEMIYVKLFLFITVLLFVSSILLKIIENDFFRFIVGAIVTVWLIEMVLASYWLIFIFWR